jgi:hypothetical protein
VTGKETDLPVWLALAFPLLFAGLWFLMSQFFAFVGGWRELARSYRAVGEPRGETYSSRSARLGAVDYRSCVRFVAGPLGLFVSLLFLFRSGRDPLFVPWQGVSAAVHHGWLFRYVDLRFDRHPDVRLRVSYGLAKRLLEAGGRTSRLADL